MGEHQPEAWPAFETIAFVPAPAGGAYRLLIAGTAVGRSDWCAQLVTLDRHKTKPGPLHGTLTRGFVRWRSGEWVTSAAVGADGRRVALAGHTPRHDRKRGEGRRATAVESAGVWDVATGRRLLRVQDGAGDALVALSPAGDRLAVSYPGRAVGEGEHTTIWRVPP